ncbi:LuxR C-terminal-related transcriptional regulator [Mycolicibacterium hippocampi]|uniref:helix-turn-helix transcriptional regulator n=1 Tax=Mycolicibacterium hippocampi TaxID=659824 RepID=UPI0035164851
MAGLAWRTELGSRLTRAWAQARSGGGEVHVLLGDAGMGKSSALSWLAGQIGPSARVLTCRGGELGTPMATAVEIATLLPIPAATDWCSADPDPMRAADVLCSALESSTEIALLVDDIHDADPSSRTALNLALRRAVLSGALVVVTGRRVRATSAFAEGFCTHELHGLAPEDAMEVLGSATDAPIHPSVARQLIDVASGNPLALGELPQALSRDQLSGVLPLPQEIPLAGNLAAVFTRQLPPPGSPARELLDRVALSSDGSWAALAESESPSAQAALGELENLGLVRLSHGRLTLRHPLLRSAVLGGMSELRRRKLNAEFAMNPAVSDEVRLAHRAQGTIGPDETLTDALVAAAEGMRAGRGIEPAARMLDLAVGMTGSDSRRGRLRLEAAELLGAAGEAEAARHRLETVLADPACSELYVASALTLATLEALDGAPAVAHQRLTECLALATPEQAGAVLARMAIPLGMLGLVAQIVETAQAAVKQTDPGSVESDVATVVLAHATSAWDEGRADELAGTLDTLDLMAAIRHDPLVGLHVGRAMSIAERYDAGVSRLTGLIGALRLEGARASLAMAYGALGETHVRASRFDDALVCLDEAVALCLATGQRAFAPFWLSLRARVAAIRGDDKAAAADLELGFAISDEQSTFGARYFLLANAGLAALSECRYHDVVGHLGECWAFEQVAGLLAPQLARWHVDLVEAYVALGRPGDAEPIVAHLAAVAATPGSSRWTGATARRARALVCAQADPQQALHLLDEAVALFDPEADAFDRARALMDRAAVSTDSAERDRARTEALYGFRRIGASSWAARLQPATHSEEMGRLTDSERRILEEVARGLTNQQIAKRLHLSAKTVANHLYRAYRKLGVSSRTEATRHMLLSEGRSDQGRSDHRRSSSR